MPEPTPKVEPPPEPKPQEATVRSGGSDDDGIYGGLIGDGSAGGSGSMPPPSGELSIGQPDVTDGELDKAIIRRYIKRNAAKLTYCFEKSQSAQATVTAKFTIGSDGTVTAAKATGLATVDQCIADVIKAIAFPKPKSDHVDVTYPFTYRPKAK